MGLPLVQHLLLDRRLDIRDELIVEFLGNGHGVHRVHLRAPIVKLLDFFQLLQQLLLEHSAGIAEKLPENLVEIRFHHDQVIEREGEYLGLVQALGGESSDHLVLLDVTQAALLTKV